MIKVIARDKFNLHNNGEIVKAALSKIFCVLKVF